MKRKRSSESKQQLQRARTAPPAAPPAASSAASTAAPPNAPPITDAHASASASAPTMSSSLDLSSDAAVQSALLSLISGTSSTMSASDALRRVHAVSKRMMDTVLLRETILSISDDPWMPDVAKGIFVEKKHEVASLDGSTRIEADIRLTPHPTMGPPSKTTRMRFLYHRRPCGSNLSATAPSEDPLEVVRPVSVGSSTLVNFECWVTAPPLDVAPELMFAIEIRGKTDRPLKKCLLTPMSDDEDDNEGEDADEYTVQADEGGVEIVQQAFDMTIKKGEDRPGQDVGWLLYTVLAFGFYDEEWDIPKLLMGALLGGYESSDDDDDMDVYEHQEEDEEGEDSDDDIGEGTKFEEDDGVSPSNNDFEVVD